jgi:uncharacterized protein (UPF0332 family)
MQRWRDLSKSCERSSRVLLGCKEYRSSISRSYYAVYSRVADALPSSYKRPKGWEGPRHLQLPRLILEHLTKLGGPQRKRLFHLVSRLYSMRISADYLPSYFVDEGQNLIALGMMTDIFRILETKYK